MRALYVWQCSFSSLSDNSRHNTFFFGAKRQNLDGVGEQSDFISWDGIEVLFRIYLALHFQHVHHIHSQLPNISGETGKAA